MGHRASVAGMRQFIIRSWKSIEWVRVIATRHLACGHMAAGDTGERTRKMLNALAGRDLARRAPIVIVAAIMVLATMLAVTVTAGVAYGDAGNGDTLLLPMGNDRLWTGETLELSDATVDNDLLAAGRTLNIEDCRLGGSVRAAGQTVRVSDTVAAESVTLAGETVSVTDTQATAVCLAARVASFSGTCQELTVHASQVTIEGTVEGDAHVSADSVVVDKDARITGTLHVDGATEPMLEEGARVSSVDYTTTEEEDGTGPVEAAATGLGVLSFAGSIIGILGTIVIALLAEWLFSRHTTAAAAMVRSRTVAHIASGVIGSLAAPVALIVLCVLVVTLPVAGCVALTLVALALVSCGFAGASLARLAFPTLGRYRVALAGGAIAGIARLVPILGTLVRIAAFVFIFGYVLQTLYLGRRAASGPGDGETDAGRPTLPTME